MLMEPLQPPITRVDHELDAATLQKLRESKNIGLGPIRATADEVTCGVARFVGHAMHVGPRPVHVGQFFLGNIAALLDFEHIEMREDVLRMLHA